VPVELRIFVRGLPVAGPPAAADCRCSASAAPRSRSSGSMSDGGAALDSSPTGEGGRSPAATCCSSVAASFCRRLLAAFSSGSPSLLTRRQISPARWFPVPPCSWLFPWSRVPWFPVSLPPLVPQAVRKRWFPAPQLSRQLRCFPTPWPVVRLHSCSPSSCTAASLSRCRHVSSPSYPWTLELRLCRTQLAWNAPGLASPSSLFETGDQSVLKRLTPAFVAPLLSPPSGML
jgi:hypothetical protein